MDTRTEKRRLGDMGENIACSFLEKRGFEIIQRNYLRKWGEIDIVTRKNGVIRFIEVKSVVTRPLTPERSDGGQARGVTRETYTYRPEDNMHPWKLKRLARAIQTYLLEKMLDCDWQLDLITVKINEATRQARVELIENIVL